MDYSGTEDNGADESYREDGAAQHGAVAGGPARLGLARYARPALVAGAIIAVVCAALLVIIFFLDSFNATVYSVGGKDVSDATDEAKSIRETYSAARLGGTIFLVTGLAFAAAGGVVLYLHRNEPGPGDGDNGEDVDFEDLGGR